ncbi:MAG: hypothetical protein WEB57_00205 [Pseudohongiellaceae bacterium]
MKRFRVITVLIAVALLGACSGDSTTEGEPQLDLAGTQGDFDRSQERVRDALTDQQRETFDEAMRTFRDYCTDNELSDEECNSSIEAAGFDAW